jgi:hypothetical protein
MTEQINMEHQGQLVILGDKARRTDKSDHRSLEPGGGAGSLCAGPRLGLVILGTLQRHHGAFSNSDALPL